MCSQVRWVYALLLPLLSVGCVLGPKTLEHSRTHYNRAVQVTAREEMLLNLVRMKYRDSIEFVKIPSITAQHTYAGAVGLRFPITSIAAPGSADVAAQSKPTISYQPEQAQDFNLRLQSRIGPETLDLLASKGWAADRLFRVIVRTLNDVDNATAAGGPTPQYKPEFEQFRFVAEQFRSLQKYRQIELGREVLTTGTPAPVADPIDSELVSGETILAAAERGYRFRREANGQMTLWTQPAGADTLVLRMTDEAKASAEMQQIIESLELQPGREFYRVVLDKYGQLKRPSDSRTGHSLPRMPRRDELVLSTRSIFEMMFYLSHAIDVPESHVRHGLVTQTYDEFGQPFDWRCMTGDLLRVKVSLLPPHHSAVSVHYRGHWFYIDDRDLDSKSTFNLLIELFNLKLRAGGGAQIPLITV